MPLFHPDPDADPDEVIERLDKAIQAFHYLANLPGQPRVASAMRNDIIDSIQRLLDLRAEPDDE